MTSIHCLPECNPLSFIKWLKVMVLSVSSTSEENILKLLRSCNFTNCMIWINTNICSVCLTLEADVWSVHHSNVDDLKRSIYKYYTKIYQVPQWKIEDYREYNLDQKWATLNWSVVDWLWALKVNMWQICLVFCLANYLSK